MLHIFVLVLALCLAPVLASAGVVINEIAWMGTVPREGETVQAAANNEWIELYNNGASEVALTGWKIQASDNTPNIILSGSVAPQGYFLLERASDEVVPGVAADLIYSYRDNALSNAGERLFLKNSSGETLDEVDAGSGWQAGDNDTKETMQRVGNSWVSASSTPLAANYRSVVSAVTSLSPSTSPSSSGAVIPTNTQPVPATQFVKSIKSYAGGDQKVVVGSEVHFQGNAFGFTDEPLENARFWWNFGDGDSREGRVVTHIYSVPGSYTVGLHVSNGVYSASDYLNVTVLPNRLGVLGVIGGERGYVEISNPSEIGVDIGGWVMRDGTGDIFSIPALTKIGAGGQASFLNKITGLFLKGESELVVIYPNGAEALRFKPLERVVAIVRTTTVSDPERGPIESGVSPQGGSMPVEKAAATYGGNVVKEEAETNLAVVGAAGSANIPSYLFFVFAVVIGLTAGAGYLFLKIKFR